MYEEDNNFTYMEHDSEEAWDNSNDMEFEEIDVTNNSSPNIDLDDEDFVSTADEAVGVLDVFNKEDDISRLKILKEIFNQKERDAFINIYKEEEASQAELNNDELDNNYYLLKYIDNHQDVLEDKEDKIAEALNLD